MSSVLSLSYRSGGLAALALSSALLLAAAPAFAVSIDGVLAGTDGNFQFSVVHTSSSGSDGQMGTVLADVGLGDGGGTALQAGSLLQIDLELDIAGSIYDASGSFELAGLLDDTNQADILLGHLGLTLDSGDDDLELDGATFYFEDRNYSSASMPPNSLDGVFLSLWGATDFEIPVAGTPVIGEAFDLVAGGTGIDLRLELANPIPEGDAMGLFAAGVLVVGASTWARRRTAARA